MSTKRTKYVICPGHVISQHDGQIHYIGARRLIQLYRVDPAECEIYEPAPWWPQSYYRMAEERHDGMVCLRPRADGDYSIPNT